MKKDFQQFKSTIRLVIVLAGMVLFHSCEPAVIIEVNDVINLPDSIQHSLPDSIQHSYPVMVVDSVDVSAKYVRYSDVSYEGQISEMLSFTIDNAVLITGDSIRVHIDALDTLPMRVKIRMDEQDKYETENFPFTCYIKTNQMIGKHDISIICYRDDLTYRYTSALRTSKMWYYWVSDFAYNYDNYNADIAVLKFDVYNPEVSLKRAPIDSAKMVRKNDNNITISVFQDSTTFYDTIPLINDSTFKYSITGFYAGVEMEKSEYTISVHKGEIVFSGSESQNHLGTVDPVARGLIPDFE